MRGIIIRTPTPCINTTPPPPAMAVLGLPPHWGFVVVFMRGLLPPPVFLLSFAVVLHVVFRVRDTVLRRRLHVSLVQVLVH